MSKVIWWSIVMLGCGLIAMIIYFALPQIKTEQTAQPAAPAIARPPIFSEPSISHPVARPLSDKPLPALDVSDASIKNALVELLSDKKIIELFQIQDFVRRIVATIDNLPRHKIALRLAPVKPAAGQFRVSGKDGRMVVAQDNAARYAVHVRLATSIESGALAALYIHFYPLFQQAYQELGYPKGYFNDRLVEVIDHLLATPEIKGPIALVQPKVFYTFADPETEALSAGQKIMIRIGSENTAIVKAKLREIRSELTHRSTTGLRSPILQ